MPSGFRQDFSCFSYISICKKNMTPGWGTFGPRSTIGSNSSNNGELHTKLEMGFLQKKQMSPPPPFGVRKIQLPLNAISNKINGDILVKKNRFHIQQIYLTNAVNRCTTNPSIAETLFIMHLYYFNYNRKSMLHIIICTFSDLDKNSCKVSK